MAITRRASEDNRLRVFLSSHFDAQTYVINIIKEGRSEEAYNEIVSCLKEVDEEIKTYISAHKHDLMSGMQDVAALVTRYRELESIAQKLRTSVDKMKKETFESYELVKNRTIELERIHETSILLKQLRQFNHAKTQLDQYSRLDLQDPQDSDLRQYSSMAKIVIELETLLQIPTLASLEIVKKQIDGIKRLGSQLRSIAQEKLLESLEEQNQATIAECLQIFYNLKSLPEIILFAIDMTVKTTIEIATTSIDLDLLLVESSTSTTSNPNTSSNSSNQSTTSSLLPSTPSFKRAIEQSISATTSTPITPQQTLLPNITQLRVAMKEMCHHWATATQEQATKIHILQRVMNHKEDPSTHEKFLDVLNSVTSTSSYATLLASGKLVDVYWIRLSSFLQDVIANKVRLAPLPATRVYPTIRKSAFELYHTLKAMTTREYSFTYYNTSRYSNNQIGNVDPISLLSFQSIELEDNDEETQKNNDNDDNYNDNDSEHDNDDNDDDNNNNYEDSIEQKLYLQKNIQYSGSINSSTGKWKRSNELKDKQSIGLFGSLITTGSPYYVTGSTLVSNSLSKERLTLKHNNNSNNNNNLNHETKVDEEKENDVTVTLLSSLSPMRDRYLTTVLNKMNDPVLQMFNESEGYSAAVPSKRDLQTLVKVIQDEITSVVIEGDRGLVKIIGKEATKTIQLLLTKVENMSSNGPDSIRITFHNGQFNRTNLQEHNKQLVVLLYQLQEILDKMVGLIVKATRDSPGIALISNLSTIKQSQNIDQATFMESVLKLELSTFYETSQKRSHDLALQLLTPLVNSLVDYFKDILMGLLKEGTVAPTPLTPNKSSSQSQSQSSTSSCSRAVETFLNQFPLALETFLLSLPRTSAVISITQSLIARVLFSFTSIACHRKPLNEQSRLLTAGEISSIDMMITSISIINLQTESSQLLEFALHELRSFRRLLFDSEVSILPSGVSQGKGVFGEISSNLVPSSVSKLYSLPYITSLRPSTLIGYLLSAGPRQIPSPIEQFSSLFQSNSSSPSYSSYISLLISFHETIIFNKSNLTFKDFVIKTSSEKKSMEIIRACLDIFVQRISVIEESQKPLLKCWYDSLNELSSSFI